jgi:hypothetical protein
MFLLVCGKDSYTERFLVLLPCTCVLQPTLVHFYQASSLLPSLREIFNHEKILNFMDCFSMSIKMIIWFLSFVLLILCIVFIG